MDTKNEPSTVAGFIADVELFCFQRKVFERDLLAAAGVNPQVLTLARKKDNLQTITIDKVRTAMRNWG